MTHSPHVCSAFGLQVQGWEKKIYNPHLMAKYARSIFYGLAFDLPFTSSSTRTRSYHFQMYELFSCRLVHAFLIVISFLLCSSFNGHRGVHVVSLLRIVLHH